jgi:methylglutaconyl-CoA hydratase
MSLSDSILEHVAEGLARITLNRPEKRNALSLEMIEELSRAIDTVREDASTRVVLLTARGKAFCSGIDLSTVRLDEPDEAGRFARSLSEVYRKLLTLPIPLLCGVDGPVMGGGGGIALAADLVWVGPNALFAFPETRLGVVPAFVSVVVRRRVSPLTLSGILTTGIPCDAARSVLVGLADFLVSDSATIEAEACTEKLLHENSGAAMRRTKEFLVAQSRGDLDAELRAAEEEFLRAVASPEARRGLEAFRGKLPLTWSD